MVDTISARYNASEHQHRTLTKQPLSLLLQVLCVFFHLLYHTYFFKGSATVPVQRMQEDIQCRDRHPLSGLHRKDKWLSFGACLADGLTVRASAERCGLAVNTAFRWRHRFPAAKDLKARKLTGIVEADETCVPESRKGARNLERKARRSRGGKASKRGLSDEQVPVLVAADRGGATVQCGSARGQRDPLREVTAPVVDEDIVLVTDGHRACPRCAAAIGAHHEALNLSRSERVRGAFHIQIAADPAVNNRHSRLKDFLRRYRGVATRYLDNYLRWFQRLELENASPRACLATAIARPCIQFVN